MGAWARIAGGAGGAESVADGGPGIEPGKPEPEEPEFGPEASDVMMDSSFASSFRDFTTRSPWAEAQRFREASSFGV